MTGAAPGRWSVRYTLQYSPDCRIRRFLALCFIHEMSAWGIGVPGDFVKRSPLPAVSSSEGWKNLYLAALFENDKRKIAPKIAEAQQAIIARRRDSLQSGTKGEERQALDTALLSLQALANALATTPGLAAQVRTASVPSGNIRAA